MIWASIYTHSSKDQIHTHTYILVIHEGKHKAIARSGHQRQCLHTFAQLPPLSPPPLTVEGSMEKVGLQGSGLALPAYLLGLPRPPTIEGPMVQRRQMRQMAEEAIRLLKLAAEARRPSEGRERGSCCVKKPHLPLPSLLSSAGSWGTQSCRSKKTHCALKFKLGSSWRRRGWVQGWYSMSPCWPPMKKSWLWDWKSIQEGHR